MSSATQEMISKHLNQCPSCRSIDVKVKDINDEYGTFQCTNKWHDNFENNNNQIALSAIENRAASVEVIAHSIHTLSTPWWVDIKDHNRPLNRNVGQMLMLMVSELGEAMEGDRKSLKDDKLPSYDMVDVEVVDCIIRGLDFLRARNAPIARILIDKCNYNAQRPDHQIANRLSDHGKKY